MATLPISYAIGPFQTTNVSIESLRMFASASRLFDKRLLIREGTIGGRKELLYHGSVSHKKLCSLRKLGLKAQALSGISIDQVDQGLSKYLFRTENGDQVKVAVGKKSIQYSVSIEVLPLISNAIPTKLILSWGIYRSDSSSFIPLELQSSTANDKKTISEILVTRNSFGTYTIEMEFESYLAPFYLSFVLRYPVGVNGESSEIKTHRQTNFRVPVGFGSGYPAPMGMSHSCDGKINFSLFSRNVENVFLCLYDNKSEKPVLEIDLDPYVNRTGDIWHASFDSTVRFTRYGYRCKGTKLNGRRNRVLLDPYAKLIKKEVSNLPYLGEICNITNFDWSGDISPRLPLEKLVVYRLNVKHFTESKSSKLPAEIAGTFSGVTEKLQHFTDLGINAILLEPVLPHNDENGPYFPFHFFSPQQVYGPGGNPVSAINSMKEMVKRMHASGIEVYMEVVFTHTTDDGALQEIDNPSYLYANGDSDLSGRNALNCNYPIVQQLIIDSLRYWVTEFHIDGFCFINASYLMKGFYGEPLTHPPLVEAMAFDPVLSKTKLIADCWDPYDSNFKDVLFPHWKRWAEINSKFSVDVKSFVRGEGILSSLATRLCGSGDIFSTGRGPAFSFNYIAKNSGLTLVDLVSYSKIELASELSWNCGEEGPTNSKHVLERRLKQIRNFLFILFVSLGVPVLNMGDECGQSSSGSPSYSDRKPFNWASLNTSFGVQMTQFISYLTSLRERRNDLLQKREFLKPENIDWYDSDLSQPKWDDPLAKFLAMLLKVDTEDTQLSPNAYYVKGDLYAAFNADEQPVTLSLPVLSEDMEWACLVDTALPFPGFYSLNGIPISEQMHELVTYDMKSYSCVLFEAKFKGA